MLRKVQYAPEGEGMAPSVETTRDFVMSDKPLHVKASLDKEVGPKSEASVEQILHSFGVFLSWRVWRVFIVGFCDFFLPF